MIVWIYTKWWRVRSLGEVCRLGKMIDYVALLLYFPQLEKKVESLNREIEETNSELETLLQRRDRENQEGGNLVSMLRSDIEQSKDERFVHLGLHNA